MKSDALPAIAAKRLLEIASTMEPAPERHIDIGKLNYAFFGRRRVSKRIPRRHRKAKGGRVGEYPRVRNALVLH